VGVEASPMSLLGSHVEAHRQKVLFRDGVVFCAGIALPFIDSVHAVCQGYEEIITLCVVVFSLIPLEETHVGQQVSTALYHVVFWAIFVGVLTFHILVAPYSFVAYCLIYLMLVITCMYLGHCFPGCFLSWFM